MFPDRLFRIVFVVGVAAFVGIVGCDNSYPESLEYPVRVDPVVLKSDDITKMIELPVRPDPLGIMPLDTAVGYTDERLLTYWDKEFKLTQLFKSGILVDPNATSSKYRRRVELTLKKHFGTPAKPMVDLTGVRGISQSQISEIAVKLKLSKEELAAGSRLYRLHCLHCHGLAGDGRGTTARWVNPHPRDYRPGQFKFVSSDKVKGAEKPLREDLLRTLREGIEGTSMPSFRLLPDEQLEALASYVIHLSIRGEAEYRMFAEEFGYNGKTKKFDLKSSRLKSKSIFDDTLRLYIQVAAESWLTAQGLPVEPIAYPYPTLAEAAAAAEGSKARQEIVASVDLGHKLFVKSCLACHEDYGRKAKYKMDYWGTMTKPADLTLGIYRGGRRPVDLYYRIHDGIFPSGMAPVESSTKINMGGAKGEENITIRGSKHMWDLVNFVRVLPYRGMLSRLVPKVHDEVYGPQK